MTRSRERKQAAARHGVVRGELFMKRFLLLAAGLLGASAALRAGPWTIPLYENGGTIFLTNQPQIDAVAFANYGEFNVDSELPFDFQNTRYFTNRGLMIGSPGFRFDWTDDNGIRRPAQNFVNAGSGRIFTLASSISLGYSNIFGGNQLTISAANLASPGYLGVGNSGLARLEGRAVNLVNGGLEVRPIEPFFFANSIYDLNNDRIPDSFDPDNAIYDYYWGTGIQDPPTRGPINTATILRFSGFGLIATTPAHEVNNRTFPVPFFTRFSTFVPAQYNTTFAYTGIVGSTLVTLTNANGTQTNFFAPTNIFRQGVVVGLGDTNLQVRTRFSPFRSSSGLYSAAVELGMVTTNVVAGLRETNAIYFTDLLAAQTNLVGLTNLGVIFATGRPIAYEVGREPSFDFAFGFNPNAELFRTFAYDTVFSNLLATNFYAGYMAGIDHLESRPPLVPGAAPTNLPGRIEIVADTVDLSKARMRGMGAIKIQANHVLNSAGAAIDVENLAYDLGSTNGLLTMQNLSKPSVDRLNGTIRAWSGLWTNQMALVYSNWVIDPTTGNVTFSPYINPIDVSIHLLILSADAVTRTQQVIVHGLALRGTNVVVNDPVVVGGSLLLDARSFTLNGVMSLTNATTDWTYANAPQLSYFTNAGTLSVPNLANYGTGYPDRRHLTNFVNHGSLNAYAHLITTDYYEDTGQMLSVYLKKVYANSLNLDGGLDTCYGDVHLYGTDLKMRNQTLAVSGALNLALTNSVADAPTGTNSITCDGGFHLLLKPRRGDLLGTSIHTRAGNFISIPHTWMAEDRGPTPEGFVDNMAIGRLRLSVIPGSELRFGPPLDVNGVPLPGKYALYVDYLELRDQLQADPDSGIVVEPGLTVYFADSNVPVSILDGKSGGRLVWARSYTGPSSGVDVVLRDGQGGFKTIRANRNLVDSRVIDSDGDGLANGFDPFPFDGVSVSNVRVVSLAPLRTAISWRAAAQTVYRIETATNLVAPVWQTELMVTNSAASSQVLTATNLPPAAGRPADRQRYYRVRYDL